MRCTDPAQDRFSGQNLQRGRRIDKATIEKHPTVMFRGSRTIRQRHLDRAMQKGRKIDPRQSQSATCGLFGYDATAGLLNNRMTSRFQFGE
jgi:hypothetical protein